jgi:chromosome segregation ATPase
MSDHATPIPADARMPGARAAASAPPDDHAIKLIREMEARLAEVTRLSAEQSRRASEIDAREVELVKARLELESQRKAMSEFRQQVELERTRITAECNERLELAERRQVELENQRQQIEQELQRARAAREQIEAQRDAVAQAQASASEIVTQAEQRRDQIERELGEQHEAIKIEREQAVRLSSELQQRMDEVQTRSRELEQQFAERFERAEQAQTQRESNTQQLINRAQEQARAAEQWMAQADQRARDADEQAKLAESKLAKAAELEAAHAQALSRAQQEAQSLTEKLAQAHEQLASLANSASSAGAAQADLAARLAAAIADAERAQKRAEHAEAQMAQTSEDSSQSQAERQKLHDQLKDEAARAERLERELASSRAAVAELEEFHAEIQREIEQSRTGLASELEQSRTQVSELQAQLARAQEQLESARASAKPAGGDLHTGELLSQRDALESRVSELEQKLAGREEAVRLLAQRLLDAEETIAQREAESAQLQHKLHLVGDSGGASAEGPAPIGKLAPMSELRRKRLARYKQLLTEQSRKIVAAKDAIARKSEQCDQIMAQRAKLAQAASELAEQRESINKAAARKGSALVTFCAAATLAIVGVIGWGVAGIIAPATYAAKASLKAETTGAELTRDEALAWTAGIEKLADSAELMGLASERFTQRGMTSLGSAGAVNEHFKNNMTLFTDKPGELTLELRGKGSERTARELETFVMALVAQANHQRDTRGDGATTALATPATAGSAPIEDQRLIYAAGIGAGGLALSILVGGGLYSMLRKSKEKFELAHAGMTGL